MSHRSRSLILLLLVMLGVGALPTISGCTDSNAPLKWTEDVLLADGRVVTLTRYQEFKGPHEIGQPPTESDYWFEFRHPDTGEKVRWESNRDVDTIALITSGSSLELLVMPRFGGMFRRHCPDPPYLLYRFENGHWTQSSIATLKGRQIRPNMTSAPYDAREEIKRSRQHLSKEQTLKKTSSFFRGQAIDFGKLSVQTFGIQCDYPFNWMLSD